MAPPPQARVLRCCRCRLFQAHQMKKSLKWTCKACGEKQSFLRAYGEGSGADCRRHVQKLNLLQGQLSEASPSFLSSSFLVLLQGCLCNLPLRSREEPVNADKENAGPGQAEHVGLQADALSTERHRPGRTGFLMALSLPGDEARALCPPCSPDGQVEGTPRSP
ncbi:MRN complex-interacting protein isoform X3 [Myotis lucifugus]|uniref:MRN complex-interacting protein isoform X3 n=1 Tax=Myotis lucifugus TaxID=59463 RepID=UPI000CCC2A73|nr:MRN complex-interacting protein isoform X3 [Myotis lucifugus]